MRGDGTRFECPKCGVLFFQDGKYVSPWDDDYIDDYGTCECCGQSLERASFTLPWEDGNNPFAFVTCPHCGHKEIKYGFGEDDD